MSYCGICESGSCQCQPYLEVKGGLGWTNKDYVDYLRVMLKRAHKVRKEYPDGEYEVIITVETRRVFK